MITYITHTRHDINSINQFYIHYEIFVHIDMCIEIPKMPKQG